MDTYGIMLDLRGVVCARVGWECMKVIGRMCVRLGCACRVVLGKEYDDDESQEKL